MIFWGEAAWKNRAACRNVDSKEFFPDRGSGIDARYGVCPRCPVRELCLETALESPWEPHGVWGGLPPDEVRSMWSARRVEHRRKRARLREALGKAAAS